MGMSVKDLIEGKGSNYILLSKEEGKYKILCECDKMAEVVDEVGIPLDNVRIKKGLHPKQITPKMLELIADLGWDIQRMSGSGVETYNELCKLLNIK
tara:strand:- start:1287 stop:1577 length:291 start_codon:yes stop_codon:yes gene_type:complete